MANKVEIDVIANDLASAALDMVKTKLAGIGGTAGMVATATLAMGAAVVTSLLAAAESAQKYDQQVKELMLRTGGTAEETSRLIQTVDDAGISYETLSTAMRFAVKNGIEPSIQSIAKLSDEYLALNTPVEKGQFLLDKFGRSGMDMARIMDKGGDAIISMSQAVEENLVVTDEAIRKSEEYRINMDNLNDTFEGFKVAVGNEVIPVISEQVAQTNRLIDSLKEEGYWYTVLHQNTIRHTEAATEDATATNSAAQSYTAMAQAAASAIPEIQDSTEATKAATSANSEMLSLVMNLQSATDRYAASQKSLTTRSKELTDKLSELGERTARNAEEWDAVTAEIKDNEQAMRDLEAQHAKAMARIAVDLYIAKLQADGFTDAEYTMALQALETTGIIDQATVEMANSFKDNIMPEVIRTKDEVKTLGERAQDLAHDYAMNFFANLTLSWDEAGGGGNDNCFTWDTPVLMADGSHRNISEIILDDKVISWHEGKQIVTNVAKVFYHPAGEADTLIIVNGSIHVTPWHKFYVDGKWVSAENLEIGTPLLSEDGSITKVISLGKEPTDEPVYNIHTDHESHNYFAGGVLVHNAQKGGNPGGGTGQGGGDKQCFTADTLILLAGGEYKNIRDMRIGDAVISWDNGARVVANVENVIFHPAGVADRLVVINNKIRVTPEHLLYVNGAWLPAGNVKIGDMLTGTNGEAVHVLSVELVDTDEAVYNIHTDHNSHNYFADGILAHNAKSGDDFGFVASGGSGSGGATNVYLTYSPLLSTVNRDEMQTILLPFILEGIRQAQLR